MAKKGFTSLIYGWALIERQVGIRLWIDFPVYDSHIKAQYEEDAIEGLWVARNRKDYQIKFRALNGHTNRFFPLPDPPEADLSGRWDCSFEIETEHPYKAIGDFKQNGNNSPAPL